MKAQGKNKILDIRKALNMTQEDFAKKLGVSQTAISLYESQEAHPSFQTCKKIVKLAKQHGYDLTVEDVRPD